MQIISGKYKGLRLKGFQIEKTRPTTSRVRESLFAMLNPYLEGAKVLDLFAGTGALGIEALSNGAYSCLFIEKNGKMLKELEKNLTKVEEPYLIVSGDFKKVVGQFDLIFLDPPYQSDYLNHALDLIKKKKLLLNNGIIVCEYGEKKFDTNGYKIIKEKKYNNKNILILEKMEVEQSGERPDC